jgi:starch phosphorylase
VPVERVLELGRGVDASPTQFDMTAFSLRLTRAANAVSQLHAETANATWQGTAPNTIMGITNGVHVPSWVGDGMRELYERYLPTELDELDRSTARITDRVEKINRTDMWDAHQRQKFELTLFAQGRLRNQFARLGDSPSTLKELDHVLDPSIFTIGFARRFATYKRAGLLFSDIDRLARLLFDAKQPVQVIFAGKAHPADRPGQQVIQEIYTLSRSEKLRGRVFIIEDYDMRIARFLVQGVDVWLNTPRRPLEASGTSGMKAAINGAVNLSVRDGWWDEGWIGDNGWAIGGTSTNHGWAIGGTSTNPDEGAQDWSDAQDLYRLLEEEIVPKYYDRGRDGRPAAWIELMRRSVASTIWRFSTTRMLHQYVEEMYLPASGAPADSGKPAKAPRVRAARAAKTPPTGPDRDAANLDALSDAVILTEAH